MVEAALAALKERADEALLHSSVGDGNPNMPIGLSLLPFCTAALPSPSSGGSGTMLAIEDRKAGNQNGRLSVQEESLQEGENVVTIAHQQQRRRMLISFPESEAYLEKLRREALMIGCC
jgi:hypothetical protein